jgi:hypothetical protein
MSYSYPVLRTLSLARSRLGFGGHAAEVVYGFQVLAHGSNSVKAV